MKRWSQYFTGAGLNGAALWVVLGYLVIVVLGLILIELAADWQTNSELRSMLHVLYGAGIVLLTGGLIYALAWRQTRSLRRSEARYRSLFEQADGILVFDRAGRIHDTNSTGSKLTGYTLDELQHLKVADLLAAGQAGLRVAQLETAGSSGSIEWQIKRKDGAARAVEVKVRQFEANQFIALLHDITTRRQLEAALQESEARLRALIGAMSDVIMVLDADGRVCRVEPTGSEALNQAHARLIGLTVEQMQPPEVAAQSREAIQRALRTRSPVTLEYPQQADGRTLWLTTTISALPNEQVLWVTRDMTEAKHRERELAAIAGLSTALRFVTTQSALLPGIMQQIPQWLEVEAVALGLTDPFANTVVLRAAYGAWEEWLGEALPLTRGLAAEVFRSGEVVVYDDLTAAPIVQRLELLSGIRAFMAMPLQAEQTPLGILAVGRTNPFLPEEVRLLAALSDIAAGALQRVIAQERAEQRAEQLGILNAGGRLLVESLSLPQVMKQLAAALLQLYPDMLALMVSRYDMAQQMMTCVYGWENGEALDVSQLPPLPLEPLGRGVQSECIHRREVIVVDDLPTRLQRAQANVILGQEPLSAIYAPLLIKGEIIGVVQVQSSVYRRFSTEDTQVLSLLASTAAVAIQNARLFEAARHQRELAEVLRDSATAINSTLQREEVLDQILTNAGRLVPNDASSIIVFERGVGHIARWQGYLPPGQEADVLQIQLPLSQVANLQAMIATGRPHVISDTDADPDWVRIPASDWIKSFAGIPLRSTGRTLGVLTVNSRTPRQYTQADAERLVILAASAAIALDNAQLFNQTQQRVKELTALYDSSVAITATLDPAAMLRIIAQRLVEVMDATSSSIISVDWINLTGTVLAEYTSEEATDGEKRNDLGMVHDLSDSPHLLSALRQAQPYITRISEPDPDIASQSTVYAQMQEIGQKSGLRVPMLVGGRARSYAAVWDSRTERQWTEPEIRLCQTLANQAAVALDNARLFEAEREQRALAEALHDTATALSRTLDLNEVLDRVLENVGKIVPNDNASILLIEGAYAQCVRLRGYIAPGAENTIKALRLPVDQTEDLRYVAATGRVLNIPNVHEYPAWSNLPSLRWIHSHLSASLQSKGRTVGFLNLESSHVNYFTEKHAAHLRAFADQAAVALENARLFEAERKQLRLTQTLRDVGALLTASMGLDEVFDRLFDLLAHVIDFDGVSIQLLQDNHNVFAARRGFHNPFPKQDVIDAALAGTLEERWGQPQQRALVISDTLTDPRWRPIPGSEIIRSWIGAALRVKGRLLGVLNVDSHAPGAYDAAAGETVAAFANQAAIAIENAQLHDAVRRHAETLETRVLERTAELERERKRTATILDAAGEGIMLADLQGRIEYVNPALERLTGYTAAEVLGRNSRIWQSGRTPVSLYEKMWRTITHGQIWQGELVNRRKDGSEYNAALTIAPVFDTDGHISGYVGVQRDISQQKELDRLKDEFVSNVSHELRTPIANVKLYINLLTRGKPEKYDDYLQTLRREAARLEKLIEDLLDLSRLDLSTTPPVMEPTNVNQLAAQLTADRAELASRKNLLIDYHAEGDIHYAQADAALLNQVISNLLTNAINYTPPDGLITVTTASQSRDDQLWITIMVQDTGPGISAQDLPHLFDRFYRGEAGRKSGAPGTGLGLSISAQIMRKLGGTITVDSRLGAGTTFTIWLKQA